METVEEIYDKYCIDAPRERSVEEKWNRSLQVLRERASKDKDISKIMAYRRALNNSAEAKNAKKTYKVRVTFTSKVDAIDPKQAVAIASAQVRKDTGSAFNAVEKAVVV